MPYQVKHQDFRFFVDMVAEQIVVELVVEYTVIEPVVVHSNLDLQVVLVVALDKLVVPDKLVVEHNNLYL